MDWIIESVTQFLLSPLWTAPVARFIDEECINFHHTEEHSAFEGDSHQRFVRLVDTLVTNFVEELGVSHDDFEAAMQARPGCAQPVVEQLTAADNFDTFKTTMLARKHQLHGDWLGGSDDEELDAELDAELRFALEASRLEAAEQADALEAQELADLQAATTASHFEAARSAADGGAAEKKSSARCRGCGCAISAAAVGGGAEEAGGTCDVCTRRAEAAAAGDEGCKKEKKRRRREIDEVRYPAKPLETSWQNAPEVSQAAAAQSSTPPAEEAAAGFAGDAADADVAAAEAAERLRRAEIRELHRKKQAEERERKRQVELDEARAQMEKKKKDAKTLAEGERLKRELQGVAASSGEGGDADASAEAAATSKGDAALGDALAALGV